MWGTWPTFGGGPVPPPRPQRRTAPGGLLHLLQRGGAWEGAASPSPLLAHPSTACVPTSYYSMWHYTVPIKGLIMGFLTREMPSNKTESDTA